MKNQSALIFALLILLSNCEKPDTTSPPILPSATITANLVAGIEYDSAKVEGTINLNGDNTAVIESGVCYDTISQPDITKSKIIKTVSSGSFTCTLTKLNSNTKYFARAYFTNAKGTTYGNEVSFTSAKYPNAVGNYYFNNPIHTLCSDIQGNIYAGGEFLASGNGSDWTYVAKWNKSTWSELKDLKSDYYYMPVICADKSGSVYTAIRHGITWYIEKHNGSNWEEVGVYSYSNYFVSDMCTDANGNVYAIGSARNANGKYYIAKWGPSGYSELGSFKDFPLSVCTDAQGNLYAAGLMNHGNGFNNFYIVKWDGTVWSELGNFSDVIFSLCIDASGNLLAAGAFRNSGGNYFVAKWNGNTWSELGELGIIYDYYKSNYFHKICTDNSGNVYGIGDFTDINGKYFVKKWDGTSWNNIAAFNNSIYSICTDGGGNIYAAGKFTNTNGQHYVAKCN